MIVLYEPNLFPQTHTPDTSFGLQILFQILSCRSRSCSFGCEIISLRLSELVKKKKKNKKKKKKKGKENSRIWWNRHLLAGGSAPMLACTYEIVWIGKEKGKLNKSLESGGTNVFWLGAVRQCLLVHMRLFELAKKRENSTNL